MIKAYIHPKTEQLMVVLNAVICGTTLNSPDDSENNFNAPGRKMYSI